MGKRQLTAGELEGDLLTSAGILRAFLADVQVFADQGEHDAMVRAAELVGRAEAVRLKWARAYLETAEKEAKGA